MASLNLPLNVCLLWRVLRSSRLSCASERAWVLTSNDGRQGPASAKKSRLKTIFRPQCANMLRMYPPGSSVDLSYLHVLDIENMVREMACASRRSGLFILSRNLTTMLNSKVCGQNCRRGDGGRFVALATYSPGSTDTHGGDVAVAVIRPSGSVGHSIVSAGRRPGRRPDRKVRRQHRCAAAQ